MPEASPSVGQPGRSCPRSRAALVPPCQRLLSTRLAAWSQMAGRIAIGPRQECRSLSYAGGGDDRVGAEPEQQTGEKTVGEEVAAAALGGDAEQLGDHVNDGSSGEGEEDHRDRFGC